MGKKIVIVSIIAVVILTLVSFSSVVGYSSVESDSKIASPLFGIRANRAINKEQDAVKSNYIGKGEKITIPFTYKNDNVNLMYRVIDSISKMNDRTFERFLDLVSSRLSHEKGFTNEKIDEIVEQFRYIREYPKEVKSVVVNDNIRKDFILNGGITTNYEDFPLICFIWELIYVIILLPFVFIAIIITMILPTHSIICYSDC